MGKLFGKNETVDRAWRLLNAVRHIPASKAEAEKYAVNFKGVQNWKKTSMAPLGVDQPGYEDLIKNIDTELLFVWGDKDELIPYSHLEEFEKLNPAALSYTVPNTGHIPHEEDPDNALGPIVKFLHDWAK